MVLGVKWLFCCFELVVGVVVLVALVSCGFLGLVVYTCPFRV